MTDTPIREPCQILQDCAWKLMNVQVSEHFQTIRGCLIDEDRTTPLLIEMVINPVGQLLGRYVDDPTFRVFLGSLKDRIHNIHGVASVA